MESVDSHHAADADDADAAATTSDDATESALIHSEKTTIH